MESLRWCLPLLLLENSEDKPNQLLCSLLLLTVTVTHLLLLTRVAPTLLSQLAQAEEL